MVWRGLAMPDGLTKVVAARQREPAVAVSPAQRPLQLKWPLTRLLTWIPVRWRRVQSVRSADRHRRGRLFCPTFLADETGRAGRDTNTSLLPTAVSAKPV